MWTPDRPPLREHEVLPAGVFLEQVVLVGLGPVGAVPGELTHVSCPSGEVGENTLLRVLHDIYVYRNRSSKTVWFTSLRSRLMVPSWFRIIWREMLRPMPEPSFLVVKNGTKICS